MTWPKHCACSPGTLAGGWHEHRCEECVAEEVRQFEEAISRWPQMLEELRGRHARGELEEG